MHFIVCAGLDLFLNDAKRDVALYRIQQLPIALRSYSDRQHLTLVISKQLLSNVCFALCGSGKIRYSMLQLSLAGSSSLVSLDRGKIGKVSSERVNNGHCRYQN